MAYFVLGNHPSSRRLDMISHAFKTLPYVDDSLLNTLRRLTTSDSGLDQDRSLRVEIIGIDCIDPQKAQIKIYVRSTHKGTGFKSVMHMMKLAGAPISSGQESSLREPFTYR
jgi:hypothetical protein